VNLTLFDLDGTLLPLDSDHAFGQFLVHIGWADAAEHGRRNDEFFVDYQAGRLDMDAYIDFATAAWRQRSQQDIAASIIGHIRQAALGEALLPFGERVARAMQRIHAQRAWTPVQRRWLDRLAKQLVLEVVIDPDFVNRAFAPDGGAKQLDKLLGGQLAPVLDDLATHLWPRTA